jgi:hypothetical protein
LADRFWEKVNVAGDDDCWEWTAGKSSDGYGCIGEGGRYARVRGTHRVAWFLEHGEWPDEHVLHRCDNPGCVNIRHLFLGTHSDNMRDRAAKGRNADTTGESNPAAKLTGEQVLEIRRLHALGHTQRSLADQFGISKTNAASIIHRRIWTHI